MTSEYILNSWRFWKLCHLVPTRALALDSWGITEPPPLPPPPPPKKNLLKSVSQKNIWITAIFMAFYTSLWSQWRCCVYRSHADSFVHMTASFLVWLFTFTEKFELCFMWLIADNLWFSFVVSFSLPPWYYIAYASF